MDLVGINPIVVHGGGPQISQLIERVGLKSTFVRGMRVTDEATMELVEMALQRINGEVVMLIERHGGHAVGLSGKDGGLMLSRKMRMTAAGQRRQAQRSRYRIGRRGGGNQSRRAQRAGRRQLHPGDRAGRLRSRGHTYNINADLAAGKIAAALKAEKLILMTDVAGIRDEHDKLVSTLDVAHAQQMIERGTISEGMIPKAECCIDALREGVAKTHIIDGRVLHSLLLETFTRSGIGTEVLRGTRVRKHAGA